MVKDKKSSEHEMSQMTIHAVKRRPAGLRGVSVATLKGSAGLRG